MTQHMRTWKHRIVLLAGLSGLLIIPWRTSADPVPGKQDRLVVEMVCTFLRKAHLARPEIGDELSKRLFRRFLKDLDPSKLYFVQSDIDEFKKHETKLDDMLLAGDLSFAYQVYDR